MTTSRIGDSPKRREDARLVTGHGAYLDDLRFDGVAHAVVLRSPHAHAWIHAIDAHAARSAPGVLAVLTASGSRAGRPEAVASLCRGQRPDRRALRLRAAAAAGRQQGALRGRARRARGGRDPGPGARRRRADRSRLRRPARRHDRRRGARARRAADRRRGARQCLHRLADRRRRGRRGRLRQGRACRRAQPRQPSHRHQPDGAARLRRPLRSRERPPYAACVEPEHPHQPQPRGARAGRRAQGRALHRARCRRRLRRQELRLCRARPGPVGGPAHRPAGEMDRQPQRGVPGRPRRARHAGRSLAGARRDGKIPRLEGGERRQSRRLHGGGGRRRADLPVRPPAGHGLSHPRRSRCTSWRC